MAGPIPRPARRLSGLMLGSAIAAIAAGAPSSALAQAFQGNETVIAGEVTRNVTGPGTESIFVGSETAIVNWTPVDGSSQIVDFLPSGHVATFETGDGRTDFAILNRILPQAPGQVIALNGTVISQIQTGSGAVRGGTVAFYTPNGLLIGPTATFDVGRLMLTTLDPADWATFAAGASTTFTAGNSASSIRILEGASINAIEEGSYVALLAPQIDMDGNVRVNGSAAYVAAEQVDLNFNQGLFGILVQVGVDQNSDNGEFAILHRGSTGGPASQGSADPHRISMITVSKNEVISMLLDGAIGFDPANSVAVENGEIILGADFSHDGTNYVDTGAGSGQGSIVLESAQVFAPELLVSSRLTARAPNIIQLRHGADPGQLTFLDDVRLESPGGRILIGAEQSDMNFLGDLFLVTENLGGTIANVGSAADGGSIQVLATGRTINVAGQLVANANATGGEGADGRGGSVLISASAGGSITAREIRANAQGFGGFSVVGDAGDGIGGNVTMVADAGTITTSDSNSQLVTSSFGGASVDNGATPGDGLGGIATLEVRNGGTVTLFAVNLSSSGSGGSYLATGSGIGGNGIGGQGRVLVQSGGTLRTTSTNFTELGDETFIVGGLALSVRGFGGRNNVQGSGGNAVGGVASVIADGGSIIVPSDIVVITRADGGEAFVVPATPVSGGDAVAGTAQVQALNGGTISVADLGVLTEGTGGLGTSGGNGGSGQGGTANILVDGGTIDATRFVYVQASGDGNGGVAGGDGQGGSIVFGVEDDGGVTIGQDFFMDAGGNGGNGSAGGDGTGGSLVLSANGGTITALGADTILSTSGIGGTTLGGGAATGGDGIGGNTLVDVMNGATVTLLSVNVSSSGVGGLTFADGAATAGTGTGGSSLVRVTNGGTLGITGGFGLFVSSQGFGGSEAVGDATETDLAAGDAAGGVATVIADGGTIDVAGEARVITTATGGTFGSTPRPNTTGGDALAGSSSINISNGGSMTAGTVFVGAGAVGGAGCDCSDGGSAEGGSASILVQNGTLDAGDADIFAGAQGGIGLQGGDALGGDSTLTAGQGAIVTVAGNLSLDAEGQGGVGDGAGSANGSGQAGTTAIRAIGNGGVEIGQGLGMNSGSTGLAIISHEAGGGDPERPEGAVTVHADHVSIAAGVAEISGLVTADSSIAISAADRIEIATPSGALRVLDAGGFPGGSVTLAANHVWAATPEILDQLRENVNFAGRNDALRAAAADPDLRGHIEGGTVTFRVGSSVFVQNSGTADDLAGVTVGAGGLIVEATGGVPPAALLFGRQLLPGGSSLGVDFFRLTFGEGAGDGAFTDDSELNLIPINAGPPVVEPPGTDLPPADLPSDVVTGPVEEGASDEASPTNIDVRQELVDVGDLSSELIIDEPVASGSDTLLWIDEEDEEDEEEEDEAAGTGPPASLLASDGGER